MSVFGHAGQTTFQRPIAVGEFSTSFFATYFVSESSLNQLFLVIRTGYGVSLLQIRQLVSLWFGF